MAISFLNEDEGLSFTRSLLVGAARPGAAIAAHVAADSDSGIVRIDVAEAVESTCFQAVRQAGTKAYIGYGERVFIVDCVTEDVVMHQMDGYFCEFFDAEELETSGADFCVLASSASELFAFGPDGALLWKTTQLGIDGVLVHSATGTHIKGSGEWDPPGGWEPFILATRTGERVSGGSAPRR
ncbi:hypothetical protein IV454_01845 [Massilia antarctica]|uniref:WD40 repeat domain-containing protein n=1 Tax=Massilia antarctica TaxID=2765360 RepID=A0AA48WEK7_9BURK|nr:hypothetical protein [Massilia antarctica]QPI50398.1 hypothetical protein IV454_01845 [Massilia antarctica]